MNDKGQIIITEILLYIIISVIILSTIIYAIETINDSQVTRINNRQLDRLLDDNLEILTRTVGKPESWQKLSTNKIEIVGLMSEESHAVSYEKIIKLKNNPQLLENNFPPGVDYSLILYPKNNPLNEETIAQKGIFTNKKQVRTKSVKVAIDYNIRCMSLNDNNETCPYEHDNSWRCKTVTIDKKTLSNTNYYLISDSNIEYILSNMYMQNITGKTKRKCINGHLEQLIKEDNQTIFLHTKSDSNNTCLVYDAEGREEFIESVIMPQVYVLKLKIAV